MKNLTRASFIIWGALLFALPTLAATTASLSPSTITVVPGQKFTVIISVNPQGTANYAEKIEVVYPPETLAVDSFTFANNWMALAQPGYDVTDSTMGVLIRTAGYPAGFASTTTFGTISFSAKKAGSGTITIGNSSLAFEVNSQTPITGNSVAVTITTPVVAPVKAPIIAPQDTKVQKTISPVTTESATKTVQESEDEQMGGGAEQSAAVTSAVSSSGVPSFKWIVIGLIALVAVGFGAYTFGKSQRG